MRRDWLAVGLALLIGFASVFSAVVAWRASVAAIEGSRLESLIVQQQARRQQIERQLEGVVTQDLRFAAIYQQHALSALELARQADGLRATDPASADALDVLAHAERALARAVGRFASAGAFGLADDGALDYDADFVLDYLRDNDPELRALDPEGTAELEQLADERTVGLVAVAAVLVAALLLLTIAQVTRRRRRTRNAFVAGGALLVAIGLVGFSVVELLWR